MFLLSNFINFLFYPIIVENNKWFQIPLMSDAESATGLSLSRRNANNYNIDCELNLLSKCQGF
jgi:hypothetical protein